MRIHRRWAQTASAVAFAAAVAWAALALPTSQAAEPARCSRRCRASRARPRTASGVSTEIFAKRRGLIFAFGSDDPDADRMADLVEAIRAQAARANIALLGVARDPAPIVATNFMKRHGFDFPVILDSDGQISSRLRVPPGTASLTVVDAQGDILGAFAGLGSRPASEDAGLARQPAPGAGAPRGGRRGDPGARGAAAARPTSRSPGSTGRRPSSSPTTPARSWCWCSSCRPARTATRC